MMDYLVLAGINTEEDKCLDIKIAKVHVPNDHRFLIVDSILFCFTEHPCQDASSIKNLAKFKAMLRLSRSFSLKIGISPACKFLTKFPNLDFPDTLCLQ